jgi:hypothetical protein
VFPLGIGLRDPFSFTLGYCRRDKGKAYGSIESSCLLPRFNNRSLWNHYPLLCHPERLRLFLISRKRAAYRRPQRPNDRPLALGNGPLLSATLSLLSSRA